MGDTYIPLLKDTKDIHYRYKMPKLTAKVEGSGNGIKTVITNMSAIAKALNRPPTYPTKYFGCELGAQVTTDKDIYIVNGSHDADKLLQLLYSFIKKFVLCPKCNNPETLLHVADKKINQSCVACGYQGVIPAITHKLTTYIMNHPPNETNGGISSGTGGSGKSVKVKGSEKKSSGKSSKKHSNGTNGNSTNGSHSPNGSTESKNNDDNNNQDDDFDDFGSDDLTADAYEERMKSLTDGFSSIHVSNDQIVERANKFYEMIKEKKESGQLHDVNVQKELLSQSSNLGIRDKATLLLSEVLFTDQILEQIKLYSVLLLRFCIKTPKAQKYLLGGFEKLVGDIYKDKLLNKVPNILKTFYDNDILDEEVLFEWYAKPTKKYVSKDVAKVIREKASAFIQWLKEAEVEDDSEDEEDKKNGKQNGDQTESDDEVEIEYSHRVTGIKVETIKPVNQVEMIGDIDIDDI